MCNVDIFVLFFTSSQSLTALEQKKKKKKSYSEFLLEIVLGEFYVVPELSGIPHTVCITQSLFNPNLLEYMVAVNTGGKV